MKRESFLKIRHRTTNFKKLSQPPTSGQARHLPFQRSPEFFLSKWTMLKRSSPTPCLASRCSRRTLFSSLSPGSRRGFAGTVLKRIQNRNFQHFVLSKLLEYETDWYDMMEILLSRLEDEPVDQDKFQASRFFGIIWFV